MTASVELRDRLGRIGRAQRQSPAVPDHVVKGITDLLQAAVQTGTGRAADIGRPVAGKTGTTTANKDGWFLGFSSGITTGVWMGRDDAKAVPGLQGGRAPAQAFASYMRYAVKSRPVEEFDVTLELPEWQLEPDEEAMFGEPEDYYFIDEQGNLVEPGRRPPSDEPFGSDAAPPAATTRRASQPWASPHCWPLLRTCRSPCGIRCRRTSRRPPRRSWGRTPPPTRTCWSPRR